MMHSQLAAAIATFIVIALSTLASTACGASFTSVASGRWSDPATWATKTTPTSADATLPQPSSLPGPGDDIFIAAGTTVIVDIQLGDTRVNTVSIQSRAVLTCPRNADVLRSTRDTQLGLTVTTLRVESNGCFSCGFGDCTSDAEPFAGKFVLRLASSVPPANSDENVRTLMVDSGGAVFLNGAPRVRPMTRLAQDAEAGDTVLQIADSGVLSSGGKDGIAWRPGDRVVIAPTDASPDRTEYGTIKSINQGAASAATMTLVDPLKYTRNGKPLILTNQADGNRRVVVDARAEIALLSRNIVIEGSNDVVSGLGGDFMIAGDNVRARLSWVEFRYLGRRGHLARYPLHIHNLGDSGRNVFVSNVAIHSSFQRGIVIHCTNGVTLVNNTVAGIPGFAYMLEDGAEQGNVLVGNLAIDVKPADYALIQTERVNPAGFWFVNAANTFVGNVAAGIAGPGFALDMDPVLASRPATLNTCPERLPGYDAKLKFDPAAYNLAINTALIKKEFQRFEDNVVHSAPSGLWLSYPFTPMFFVNRTVPLVRFTAWNMSPRQLPSWSLESSDGVSLQFDACMRLQGQRGMHIYGLTCVNALTATWASCVNTFDGTTVAWVGDAEIKHGGDGLLQSRQTATTTKSFGTMLTHLEPQVFLKTQVVMMRRDGSWLSSNQQLPLFASVAKGGPLATLNTLVDAAITADYSASPGRQQQPPGQPPLIHLNAGDVQVITDIHGDIFGAGPGAVVAATSVNATGLDPFVQAYASDRCSVGTYAQGRDRPLHLSSSALPNGRIIGVTGGLPMLCTGGGGVGTNGRIGPLRFATISIDLRDANWARVAVSPLVEEAGRIDRAISVAAAASLQQSLPPFNSWPALLPLTQASMDPSAGGFFMRFAGETWANPASRKAAQSIEIALSPTIQPSDSVTIYISGLPPWARVAKQQPGGTLIVSPFSTEDGGMMTTTVSQCQQAMAGTATTSCQPRQQPQATSAAAARPRLCICALAGKPGDMVVRFYAKQQPRQVGLHTSQGTDLGIYDFPSLRIDLV